MAPEVREERKAELVQVMNRYQQMEFFKNITAVLARVYDEKFDCAIHLSIDQLAANMEFEYNCRIRDMATANPKSNNLHLSVDLLSVRCHATRGGVSVEFSEELKLMETGQSSINIGHFINWNTMSDGGINHMLAYLRQKISTPPLR